MSDMTKEMQGRMVLAASAGEHGLVAQQLAELLNPALEDAERYRHMVASGSGRVMTMFHSHISWNLAKGEKEVNDQAIDLMRAAARIKAAKGLT